MIHDIEETAVFIRDAIENVPKQLNANHEEIAQIEREIQDLLHVLEFTKFNASEGYKLSKQLQAARQERRKLKNENELLGGLSKIMLKIKPQTDNLNAVIGDIRKRKQMQTNRTYHCRVRKDLQDRMKD
jgi:5'-deoxynucleotidase YfbR-like HD superfamily hydrolase